MISYCGLASTDIVCIALQQRATSWLACGGRGAKHDSHRIGSSTVSSNPKLHKIGNRQFVNKGKVAIDMESNSNIIEAQEFP
jgi:hypothetical protein